MHWLSKSLQQMLHFSSTGILHILLHFTYFSIVSLLLIHLDDSLFFLLVLFHVSMCASFFLICFRFSFNQNKCFSLQWKRRWICAAIPFTFGVVIFVRNTQKNAHAIVDTFSSDLELHTLRYRNEKKREEIVCNSKRVRWQQYIKFIWTRPIAWRGIYTSDGIVNSCFNFVH